MKCLYCHENVQPEGDTCPKCGLPLIEDTTLLEVGASEKPSALDWLNERKPILLGALGGFAAAAAIAIIIISASAAREPQVNQALTPPAAPMQTEPIRLASRSTVGAYSPTSVPAAAPAAAPTPTRDITPVLPQPAVTRQPADLGVSAQAPAVEDEGDISAPPPLPANFEYDPQLGFAPPPPPARPVRHVEPEWEPTPPAHVLAMDPNRRRGPQYVIVVPNQRSAEGVSTSLAGGAVRLPDIDGE